MSNESQAKTAREKAEQLGMPFGTASHKLRKQILFHLLQKYHEDICFRCKQQILSIDELSVDHKEPWFKVSSDLFWDINNIAFSHLKCNTPDRPRGWAWRFKNPPDGMSWCSKCQNYRPVSNFSKTSRKRTGLNNLCKVHDHYWRK